MAILREPGFDFTRQAVLPEPVAVSLTPARDMQLKVIRNGLHVSGKSAGTSLVILPQQFTHCLVPADRRVKLVRANLMMTGLLFSGEVDTDITFEYGIFSAGCRRADLADMKQMDLKINLRQPHLTGGRLFPDWDGAMSRLQAASKAIR
jgi:hypothetical protein